MGEGEFMSEELKEFVKEIETIHGLASGQLVKEIKARLKGSVEPSVEQMRDAIRKEIRATEEEFLESVSSPKDQERKEAQEEQTPVSDRQGKTATSGAAEQPGG
jgi:hypothetical protein